MGICHQTDTTSGLRPMSQVVACISLALQLRPSLFHTLSMTIFSQHEIQGLLLKAEKLPVLSYNGWQR